MKRTTAIPQPAARLYSKLRNHYDKEHPLVLNSPASIVKKIDGKGNLEFEDWDVIECWPSAGSVTVREKDGRTAHIFDLSNENYEQGDDIIWLCEELEDKVTRQLEGTKVQERIYLLTQTLFHAEPNEMEGCDHTYCVIASKDIDKVMQNASRIIGEGEIDMLPEEKVISFGDRHGLHYKGAESIVVKKGGGRRYEEALKLKLDELRLIGTTYVRGETLSVTEMILDKQYPDFYTRAW